MTPKEKQSMLDGIKKILTIRGYVPTEYYEIEKFLSEFVEDAQEGECITPARMMEICVTTCEHRKKVLAMETDAEIAKRLIGEYRKVMERGYYEIGDFENWLDRRDK